MHLVDTVFFSKTCAGQKVTDRSKDKKRLK